MLQGRRKKKRGLELLEISSQQKRLTLIFTEKNTVFCANVGSKNGRKNGEMMVKFFD